MKQDSPASITMHSSKRAARHQRMRHIRDRLAQYGIGLGGLSVLFAIILIFFYLLYVTLPLFMSADASREATYTMAKPEFGKTVSLAVEEQNRVAVRFTERAQAVFFDTRSGNLVKHVGLPFPAGTKITAVASSVAESGLVAYATSDGRVLIARHKYKSIYKDAEKPGEKVTSIIVPSVEYPVGDKLRVLDEGKQPVRRLALQTNDEGMTIVGITAEGKLVSLHIPLEDGEYSDDAEPVRSVFGEKITAARYLLLDKEQRNLYVLAASGKLVHVDISDKEELGKLYEMSVTAEGDNVAAASFLSGSVSIIIASKSGKLEQWFTLRNDKNEYKLTKIRSFEPTGSEVTVLKPEQARKGFVAVTRDGEMLVYHSTAGKRVLKYDLGLKNISNVALSPRANGVLVQSGNRLGFLLVDNEHPEISWSALWGKVWYEGYQKPDYIWQSSSADNDFESKLSLTPLVFGTLKAAFYAMLFAIPLAILGAIYTAYFMAPKMRQVVKPTVEIMEALPTVILGFLAGLWLAPVIEANLPGIFSMLLLLPLGVILSAWGWQKLPDHIRHRVPDGWQAALLIPVLVIIGWAAMVLSQPMEVAFFGGDMRTWLKDSLGLDFDQRNAMVVGFAMGFAVIPTIFSIAEDAIFSVPRTLSYGSLALGATPWQTMTRVVLLTASPGIFSAIMMGLGRAVGETMIVLMATGNTPVMDMNIFQGMRTLSANIAVEMPESEVDSTHFRVLFLAAFVLFVFTFAFNTLAEIIRQRLRRKYSSL